MKPAAGWDNQTARLPIEALDLLAARPEQRVALAGEDDHVRTGAVKVGFLVTADSELRDMAAQRVFGNFQAHLRTAATAFFPFEQLQIFHVGDEVGLPGSAGKPGSRVAEIIFLGIKAVAKNVRAVENEIAVMDQIHHARRAGDGEKTRRLVAVAIEELMPGVQRRREQRTFLPFESSFRLAFIPDRRRATAADDVDQLFVHMFFRFERFACRDFADISVVGFTGAFQAEAHAQPTGARPWRERFGGDVADEKTLDQRNAFALDPLFVGAAFLGNRFAGYFWFDHFILRSR